MDSLKCLTAQCVNLLHKNRLLQPLIKSELKSSLLSSVEIEHDVQEKEINKLILKLKLKNEEELEKFLSNNNLDKESFNDLALYNMRSKKYCSDKFDSQSEKRFLERKSKLDIVTYSLLRVSNLHKCKELFFRIREKESDFGEISSTYSEGIEKKTRGIVGPISLEKSHPTLAEHLRTSAVGVVSEPIKIDNFYLITRVESYEPAQLDNYMRDKMNEELFEVWLDNKSLSIFNEMIGKLKSNTNTQRA